MKDLARGIWALVLLGLVLPFVVLGLMSLAVFLGCTALFERANNYAQKTLLVEGEDVSEV
jgi:hypothetical protein